MRIHPPGCIIREQPRLALMTSSLPSKAASFALVNNFYFPTFPSSFILFFPLYITRRTLLTCMSIIFYAYNATRLL